MNYFFSLSIPAFLLFSCSNHNDHAEKSVVEQSEETNDADLVLRNTLKAHGSEHLFGKHIEFDFRDYHYSFEYTNAGFIYTRSISGDAKTINDSLINGRFTRYENGEELNLLEEEKNKFSESINSVIYFATLPHKLRDKAVNASFIESQTFKGQVYDLLQITFDAQGGGTDHDDVFMYWVNHSTHFIDFMAYSYHVNGGGVRFRAATNPTTVKGIRFQDYVNYEAPNDAVLSQLLKMHQEGKLNQLSEIKLENITVN